MRVNYKLCVFGLMISVIPFVAQNGRGTAPHGNATSPQNSGDAGNRGNAYHPG